MNKIIFQRRVRGRYIYVANVTKEKLLLNKCNQDQVMKEQLRK